MRRPLGWRPLSAAGALVAEALPVAATGALVAAALLPVACGGGGSGAAAPRSVLSGRLLPAPGSGNEGSILEQEPNDSREQAQSIGTMGPGTRYTVVGRITDAGSDPFDGFRVRSNEPTTVRVSLDADQPAPVNLDVLIFDVAAGQFVQRFETTNDPEEGSFQIAAAGREYDVVVVAAAGTSSYRLSIVGAAALAPASTPAVAPPTPPATPRGGGGAHDLADERLRAWLGADHPMVAGEVVVREEAAGAAPLAMAPAAAAAITAVVPELRLASHDPHSGTSVWRLDGAFAGALAFAASGGTPEQRLATAQAAARIAELPGVRAASPNYVYRAFAEPDDTHYQLQWHYRQLNLPQAWDVSRGSDRVVVAIADSGVVLSHPDLSARLVAGYDFVSDVGRALDGNGIDPDPNDPGDGRGTSQPSSFHGTHVAGTVGASSNNQTGVAGVDWSCRLMPIRVLGQGGSGTLNDIAQGILFAAGLPNASGTVPAQRADVLNMSLGGPAGAAVLEAAVRDARAAGVLPVAAAGNDDTARRGYPASYDGVVSVGAVRFDRRRAPYSNFADTVDLVAPGGDTSVDQNGDNYPDGVLSTLAKDSGEKVYGFLQGTSMAAPHVAGVAALIRAAGLGASRDLSAAEIESILFATVQQLTGGQLGAGRGLVDALAAVRMAANASAGVPSLDVTPASVDFGATRTTERLLLRNLGGGTISVQEARITYQQGTGWLSATLVPSQQPGPIDFEAVQLAVDRMGLQVGSYAAFVEIVQQGQMQGVQVPVLVQVGETIEVPDTVYVLLVDANTFATRAQTDTDRQRGFGWSLTSVAAGTYLLVAGTDRDDDDVIAEDGDVFGIWPTIDNPILLELGNDETVSDLDFVVQPVDFGLSGQSAGPARGLQLRRLR